MCRSTFSNVYVSTVGIRNLDKLNCIDGFILGLSQILLTSKWVKSDPKTIILLLSPRLSLNPWYTRYVDGTHFNYICFYPRTTSTTHVYMCTSFIYNTYRYLCLLNYQKQRKGHQTKSIIEMLSNQFIVKQMSNTFEFVFSRKNWIFQKKGKKLKVCMRFSYIFETSEKALNKDFPFLLLPKTRKSKKYLFQALD